MHPRDYVYGWRQDLEDLDYLYGAATKFKGIKYFGAPDELLNDWLRVEQQKRMGSCSGQSQTAVQECLNKVATGNEIQLSAMFAYLAGQRVDRLLGKDQGATISGSVKGAREFGCCLEETFPYPDQYTTRVPQSATDEAAQHRVRSHTVLSSYDEVFDFIASGNGFVQIGIPWQESLAMNEDGVIEEAAGETYGGHAVAIVGYTRDKWPILHNSHGKEWGKNGRAKIHPRLFDQWGRDGYSEMIGISDLEEWHEGESRLNWVKNNPYV